MKARIRHAAAVALSAAALLAAPAVRAWDWTYPGSVAWQYRVAYETVKDKKGQDVVHRASVWLPPGVETVRAVYLSQTLGIEGELQLDPAVRQACYDSGIAIVRIERLSRTFQYWKEGNRDGERLLHALDVIARDAGHPELRRVPWITAGHSIDGIFCRNAAYWKPDRVAAIVHIKSGNFHQKNSKPPEGTLEGIPLVAINGQLETYGPETGIDPEWGRETQWVYMRKDIWQFKEQSPNYLMSTLVQPGDDHFNSAPELGAYVALFLRKTARYRLPEAIPAGDDPVKPLPLKVEDGWLTDADLHNPRHPAAAYAAYTGDKAKAMWHYDRELALANEAFHRNLGKHQVIDNPAGTWLDEGDGWTFRAKSAWLATGPEKFGGKIGNQPVSHADTPFIYRARQTDPVVQTGPDTFRALRLPGGKNPAFSIGAYHPGDASFRATYRWGSIGVPQVKGAAQSIDFPAVGDVKADAKAVPLKAKASSGLPVWYEVDYGPVVVSADGALSVADLPAQAQFPIACSVTAYQVGRRIGDIVQPAAAATATFDVVAP